MMTDPIPLSKLARAALWMALICGALALISGVGNRFGWWPFDTALMLLGGAFIGAVIAMVLAMVGLVVIRLGGKRRGAALSIAALLIAIPLVLLPLWHAQRAGALPAIHDISTDTLDPPVFVALLPVREASPNGSAYGGEAVATLQRAAYPGITTLLLVEPPDQVFAQVRGVVRSLGWEEAAADLAEGRVEAVATTFWFGFKDDVVIRLRPQGNGARLDIRSASRVGRSDLGANAARIREFMMLLTQRTPAVEEEHQSSAQD
ncbi:MAG: hypothetical protein A2V90_05930 [Gammaproteobacteria bacterium RBG_16_57_12]|nr:MAG: hypothetical protein A2V90_05930 [Gammaproteobacteria bacterium RBG_16_57_12]